MARKKTKRVNLRNKEPKATIPKKIIPSLIFVFVLVLVFLSLKGYVGKVAGLPIFKLEKVFAQVEEASLTGAEAFDYCSLSAGVSLLEIDLEALRDRMLHAHPELKYVSVYKDYPNAIKVVAEKRKPLAQILTKEFFLVDEEGFILKESFEDQVPELVLIVGISSRKIKKGAFNKSSSLLKAIDLIKLLESTEFKDSYRIEKIDVTSLHNISFYIEKDVEIKLGRDGFREKITRAQSRLPNLDLTQIRYIDLRFKDLIVGPR